MTRAIDRHLAVPENRINYAFYFLHGFSYEFVDIQEQIEIAGELWGMSDFEVNALCGIVADAFADQGIKMEALV